MKWNARAEERHEECRREDETRDGEFVRQIHRAEFAERHKIVSRAHVVMAAILLLLGILSKDYAGSAIKS